MTRKKIIEHPLKKNEFAINAGAQFNIVKNLTKLKIKNDGTAELTLSFKIAKGGDLEKREGVDPGKSFQDWGLFDPNKSDGFVKVVKSAFFIDISPEDDKKIAFLTNNGDVNFTTKGTKTDHGNSVRMPKNGFRNQKVSGSKRK